MQTPKKSKRGRPRDANARKNILAAAAALLDEGGIGAVTMEAIAARAGVGKPTIYREWPNAQAVAMTAFLETAEPAPQGPRARSPLEALRRQLRKVAGVFATRAGRNTAMMIAAAQNDSELAKVFRNHFILKSREEGRTLLAAAIAARELRKDIDVETAEPAPQGPRARSPLEALRRQLRKVAGVFATRAGRNTAMMIAAAQNDSELAKVFRNHFILNSREEGRMWLAAAIGARELRKDVDIEAALDLIYAPLYFRLLIGHGPLDAAFTDGLLELALKGLAARRSG